MVAERKSKKSLKAASSVKPSNSKIKEIHSEDSEKLSFFQRVGLFFYDHRLLTLILWIAILVFGVVSYTTLLKRQGFPAVNIPVSIVSGTYFVNDRAKVDADVTRPLSEAITDVDGVKNVMANAGDNFYTLIVEYDDSVSSTAGSARIEQAVKQANLVPANAAAQFNAIDAGRFNNRYDMLVSVYFPGETDQKSLEERAGAFAAELEKYDAVQTAEVTKLFESGVNPQTGEQVTQQRSYDRIGVRQGDRFGYYPSVIVGVVGTEGSDTIHLSEDTQNAINEILAREQFANTKAVVSADFAESINTQISSLQRSLLEGLIAVLIVSFLLISWRAGLATAIAMITVLCLTAGVLYVSGNSLNTITLFALVLSLGLIVDDATIMAEAIDVAKRERGTKREVVSRALRRVARASTAGTFTTMLAFAPMLFIGGILGEFIRVLPITIIISLASSLLVSMTLIPFLSRYLILSKRKKGRFTNPVQKFEQLIAGGLARLLLAAGRSRWKAIVLTTIGIGISVAFIFGSFYYFQKLQFNIFPATKDSNTLMLSIRYQPGTSIEAAQVVADEAYQTVRRTLGTNIRRMSYMGSGSTTEALAQIELIDYHEREVKSPELAQKLNEALPKPATATLTVRQVDVGPPQEELPFRVQILEEDPARAKRISEAIAQYLQGKEIARPNGTTVKITRTEIANSDFVVRRDGRRVTEVRAGYDATDTSALVTLTKTEIERDFPLSRLAEFGVASDALVFDFGSESDNQESFSSMLIAFPILLLVMYLLLTWQFRSFLQPVLIFLAIPFSFFGVAAGLYYTDNPLSFFVMIGFFALIGIAVNNTIMLVDYANQARVQGAGRVESIALSVKARFRPLLTTSLTSVVALIPLALSEPFWESISVTLIFGLLSSTFLVIVSFPYIFLVGELLRIFGHRAWRRRLNRRLQFFVDIFIWPIRLLAFMGYVGFRHQYDNTKKQTK